MRYTYRFRAQTNCLILSRISKKKNDLFHKSTKTANHNANEEFLIHIFDLQSSLLLGTTEQYFTLFNDNSTTVVSVTKELTSLEFSDYKGEKAMIPSYPCQRIGKGQSFYNGNLLKSVIEVCNAHHMEIFN